MYRKNSYCLRHKSLRRIFALKCREIFVASVAEIDEQGGNRCVSEVVDAESQQCIRQN